MWGYFVQASYQFQIEPLWAYLPEGLQEAVLTASLRYEAKDTDISRHSAVGDQKRLTLGLNFRPIPALVWKLDLQWNNRGVDGRRGARDFFTGAFWKDRDGAIGPDRFVASVAYMF